MVLRIGACVYTGTRSSLRVGDGEESVSLMQRQWFPDHVGREVQHVVMLCHFIAHHTDKEAQHIGAVSSQDELKRLLRYILVGCHIVL